MTKSSILLSGFSLLTAHGVSERIARSFNYNYDKLASNGGPAVDDGLDILENDAISLLQIGEKLEFTTANEQLATKDSMFGIRKAAMQKEPIPIEQIRMVDEQNVGDQKGQKAVNVNDHHKSDVNNQQKKNVKDDQSIQTRDEQSLLELATEQSLLKTSESALGNQKGDPNDLQHRMSSNPDRYLAGRSHPLALQITERNDNAMREMLKIMESVPRVEYLWQTASKNNQEAKADWAKVQALSASISPHIVQAVSADKVQYAKDFEDELRRDTDASFMIELGAKETTNPDLGSKEASNPTTSGKKGEDAKRIVVAKKEPVSSKVGDRNGKSNEKAETKIVPPEKQVSATVQTNGKATAAVEASAAEEATAAVKAGDHKTTKATETTGQKATDRTTTATALEEPIEAMQKTVDVHPEGEIQEAHDSEVYNSATTFQKDLASRNHIKATISIAQEPPAPISDQHEAVVSAIPKSETPTTAKQEAPVSAVHKDEPPSSALQKKEVSHGIIGSKEGDSPGPQKESSSSTSRKDGISSKDPVTAVAAIKDKAVGALSSIAEKVATYSKKAIDTVKEKLVPAKEKKLNLMRREENGSR